MKERTEADMLAMTPLSVKLGSKEYDIPILTILPSRQWRLKLNDAMAGIVKSFEGSIGTEDAAEKVSRSLVLQLIEFPEKVAELVFAYAGTALPQEEVLASASEEQFASAFSAIMGVAYPYLRPLALAMRATRGQMPKSPATEQFLN